VTRIFEKDNYVSFLWTEYLNIGEKKKLKHVTVRTLLVVWVVIH